MKCNVCNERKATEEHHALITRRDAQGCSEALKEYIEQDINKIHICQQCHTGNGHITREKSLEIILKSGYALQQIEDFFDGADKLVKVPFKRFWKIVAPQENLDRTSPAVLAALAIRTALELRGNEAREVSEILQIAKKIIKSSTSALAAKDATAAVIDKFCRNSDRQEMYKPVLKILQENIEYFRYL